MRRKIWVPVVSFLLLAVCFALAADSDTVLSNAVLDQVYGGDGSDCRTMTYSGCAPDSGTFSDCIKVGDYCADVVWRTECLQARKECQDDPSGNHDCQDFMVDCEGSYEKYICTPDSGTSCSWDRLAYYACSGHPGGDTTKEWCENIW